MGGLVRLGGKPMPRRKGSGVALPHDEMQREMKAVETCWLALQRMTFDQRLRVLAWLNSWTHDEAPDGESY